MRLLLEWEAAVNVSGDADLIVYALRARSSALKVGWSNLRFAMGVQSAKLVIIAHAR